MSLRRARTVEVLQCIEKDDFYNNYLRGLVVENVQNFFGVPITIRWRNELNLFADVVYYGLTTLGSLQTLGEEYTGLIQVDDSRGRIPTFRQRLLMVMLRTVLPFAIERILSYLENQLNMTNVDFIHENIQSKLKVYIPKFRAIILLFHRLHLSIFYIDNIYSKLSKRVAVVEYVTYSSSNSYLFINAFKRLGWLSFLQTLVAFALQIAALFKTYQTYKEQKAVEPLIKNIREKSDQKCSLCLEKRQHTTTTICGHLFCWHCIHDCINIKPECPICREEIKPNNLICLQNFE